MQSNVSNVIYLFFFFRFRGVFWKAARIGKILCLFEDNIFACGKSFYFVLK